MGFLPDATDFTDMEKKKCPENSYYGTEKQMKECPKCQGHGGWNLRTNCYYKGRDDVPAHYHHFSAMCGNCWGWGWIPKSQTCIHEWSETATLGRCLHEWACKHCGATRVVDSSD